ncbi:hypothetical protein [Rhizobium tumorigenes]|uniref:Uncharacterized protein n=1 Tax=Rhizobium tumorigenes TaxID=2041385 RepID=A0AAF1KTZ6_9HYPH|nr:hypothetical protein [Rhizobium tumorigenes]WFR97840.1 hypothetical protein PR017_18180 [Rhizobium tumorigenes]
MQEKKFRESQAIAETIKTIAKRGMRPRALIEAVKLRHPSATKKEIARAAFLTVILSAEFDLDDTQALHDLAEEPRDEPE